MRRIKPAILLGIASMILVVAFVVWDSPWTSPGALSGVHARIAGIEEADCAACHGDDQVTMAQACGKCHAAIEQQIAAKTGLHGKLKTDVSRCGTCHVEHHGTDLQLAGTRSFALAGVASRDEFKHETLDFRLTGAH